MDFTPSTKVIPKDELPDHPGVPGINLVWSVDNTSDTFWQAFERELVPLLKNAQRDGLVNLALPYEHSPLSIKGHGDSAWTHSLLVIGQTGADVKTLATSLIETSLGGALAQCGRLLATDMQTLQPGLDMFYPVKNPLKTEGKMVQMLEYVVSNPDYREHYYPQQYLFSSPAMRSLHERDLCGRFIGFEHVERLHATESVPIWDVLHVFAFTPWQFLRSVPTFSSTWQAAAERVFGPDANWRTIQKVDWAVYRVKGMKRGKQRMQATLRSASVGL